VTLAQLVGLTILIALIVAICVIAVRRSMLARSGGIDMCWRTDLTPGGRGWVLGQGRFHGSDLRLYRSFSPLPIASRVLDREDLALGDRRDPLGTEPDLLPPDAVIVRCTDAGRPLELALAQQALTGLKSWLESLPPATGSPDARFSRRATRRS
jgi:Protein of unknown function (DUF2550)